MTQHTKFIKLSTRSLFTSFQENLL